MERIGFITLTAICALLIACALPLAPSSAQVMASTSQPANNSAQVLNSRYNDDHPALSGNGQLLAFVSNRNGNRNLLIYDLQQQHLLPLPGLNRPDAIAESPSLSYTGRYLAYISSDRGIPEIRLYDRAIQRSQVLTPTYQGWVRRPSISPDGRYVVYESGNQGQWDIVILDRGPGVELDLPDAGRPRFTPERANN